MISYEYCSRIMPELMEYFWTRKVRFLKLKFLSKLDKKMGHAAASNVLTAYCPM